MLRLFLQLLLSVLSWFGYVLLGAFAVWLIYTGVLWQDLILMFGISLYGLAQFAGWLADLLDVPRINHDSTEVQDLTRIVELGMLRGISAYAEESEERL